MVISFTKLAYTLILLKFKPRFKILDNEAFIDLNMKLWCNT